MSRPLYRFEPFLLHDVALSLNGENVAKTEGTMDLAGKSFSTSMWVNYSTNGTLLQHGTADNNFTVSIEGGKLAVSVAGEKVTSSDELPADKWIYLNVSYDAETNTVSADELVEDAQVSVYAGAEQRALSTDAVSEGRHFLTIGGQDGEDDVLTFVVSTADGEFMVANTETFVANAMRGTMAQPVVLQLGEATGIDMAVSGMSIKSIQLFDASGRLMRSIEHPTRLLKKADLKALPAGVYYQQATFDNGRTQVQKLMR